jgi:hypothetical protein
MAPSTVFSTGETIDLDVATKDAERWIPTVMMVARLQVVDTSFKIGKTRRVIGIVEEPLVCMLLLARHALPRLKREVIAVPLASE